MLNTVFVWYIDGYVLYLLLVFDTDTEYDLCVTDWWICPIFIVSFDADTEYGLCVTYCLDIIICIAYFTRVCLKTAPYDHDV